MTLKEFDLIQVILIIVTTLKYMFIYNFSYQICW